MARIKVPVTPPTEPPEPIIEPVAETPRRDWKKHITRNRLIAGGASLLLLVLFVTMFSLIQQRNSLEQQVSQLSDPQTTAADEARQLEAKIGKFIQLPTGETPTVITVSDVAKAQQQSNFFTGAQNGDKVLLYNKSAQAILYRPSTEKVIKMASVGVDGQ